VSPALGVACARSLNVTHTYVGDLRFALTHLDTGTTVVFINRPTGGSGGCSSDDIAATLADEATLPVQNECSATPPAINGTFIPNSALAAFDGEDLSGTWRLNAADLAALDVGTVNSWCLRPAQ
jgi:subtilisin-like proprotein convertase family protein